MVYVARKSMPICLQIYSTSASMINKGNRYVVVVVVIMIVPVTVVLALRQAMIVNQGRTVIVRMNRQGLATQL